MALDWCFIFGECILLSCDCLFIHELLAMMSEIICQSNDLYDSDNLQSSEQVQLQFIFTLM